MFPNEWAYPEARPFKEIILIFPLTPVPLIGMGICLGALFGSPRTSKSVAPHAACIFVQS